MLFVFDGGGFVVVKVVIGKLSGSLVVLVFLLKRIFIGKY